MTLVVPCKFIVLAGANPASTKTALGPMLNRLLEEKMRLVRRVALVPTLALMEMVPEEPAVSVSD